jgi:catechol 2,3-dioxygenase-like lactoylglutathione lyase family enzyme
MLSDAQIAAVVAVSDMERAKDFYGRTLGLEMLGEEEPGGIIYSGAGNGQLLVYPSGYAGTNKATTVSWLVGDLDAEISALASKGVSFEHYDDLPETTREGDVHVMGPMRAAWFTDPDGNILNIYSRDD